MAEKRKVEPEADYAWKFRRMAPDDWSYTAGFAKWEPPEGRLCVICCCSMVRIVLVVLAFGLRVFVVVCFCLKSFWAGDKPGLIPPAENSRSSKSEKPDKHLGGMEVDNQMPLPPK